MIGITMGDPNGVGPELVLRAFRAGALAGEFAVIGDFAILAFCNDLLQLGVPLRRMRDPKDYEPESCNVLDQGILKQEALRIGHVSRVAGEAARHYVVQATMLALRQEIGALVTLPINKEATRLSDPAFTGHTELIAELCEENDYTMMLASERLLVTHVTTHVSMIQAIALITSDRVAKVIELTDLTLHRLRPESRLAVAGLNPHAGENGAFGVEELECIRPAIEICRAKGIDVVGPCPPDSVFLQACRGKYDAVVAMYHDQGHIPLKMLDFEGGVNVTLGLKVIRTSVDHGTAFDIAYKGLASTRSLVEAYDFAKRLVASTAGQA